MVNSKMIEDIYWVCVFYNKLPILPPTINSLAKIFEIHSYCTLNILVYDNSPIAVDMLPFISQNINVSYIHNPKNPGLAVAYNCALQKATDLKKKWLVLLDQDSVLGSDFLVQLMNSFDVIQNDDSIVAIIPKVYHEQRLVSPSRLCCGVLNLPFIDCANQKINGNISAINSGSTISVNFLNSISGFNEDFSLDMLDHWLFYEIFLFKRSVFLNSATIQHSLSVAQGPISYQRYKSILLGEKKLFCDIKRKKNLYSLVLLLRTIRQLLNGRFIIAKMTILFLLKCHAN